MIDKRYPINYIEYPNSIWSLTANNGITIVEFLITGDSSIRNFEFKTHLILWNVHWIAQ